MDVNSLINQITILSGIGVTVATQILKSKVVPMKFQDHPVPTTIAVSIVATWLALVWQHFDFAWNNWKMAGATFVVVVGVAVNVYNHLIRNWTAVRNTEG